MDWIEHWQSKYGGVGSIYLRLRWVKKRRSFLDDLVGRGSDNREAILDAIDAALTLPPIYIARDMARSLENILMLGGSAWRVSRSNRALERRVDTTVSRSRDAAVKAKGGASAYLAEAWRLIYGRDPDPSNAYSAAIKAVEAAAAPVVSPKNKRATLGTILRDIEAAPQKWQLAISRSDGKADLGPLLEPMRLLWNGQTDRHGSGSKPVRIAPEAATAAVHLALMLVHWFQSGLVSRKP